MSYPEQLRAAKRQKAPTSAPAKTVLRPSEPAFDRFDDNRPRHISESNSASRLRSWEDFEERSAIMEHEGGMPKQLAETIALIVQGPPLVDFEAERWQSIVDGALRFADRWAGRAFRFGWTVEELFGFDPLAPAARVERRGLAFLLGNGAQVVSVDGRGADIITRRGCPCRKSDPDIPVVKSAEERHWHNASNVLNRSGNWWILG